MVDHDEVTSPSLLSNASKKFGAMVSGLKKPKSSEELELQAAQREYDERVAGAFASLAQASGPWDQALRSAQAGLAKAKTYGTGKVAEFARLALYEHSLVTPSGNVDLESEQVRAAVDTAGNLMQSQNASLGRVAAGDILFGPAGAIVGGMFKKSKTTDTRELYILIESDRVAAAVACDPDRGSQARQFVAAIHNTASGAPARAQYRSQLVPQAQRYLDDVTIQRFAALAGPRAEVNLALADTSRVAAAKEALG